MNLRKLWSYVSLFFMSMANAFAVTVVQESTGQGVEPVNSTLRTVVLWIFSLGLIVLMGATVIFIVAWIFFKIYKKITEYNKRKHDFLYYDFETNAQQCHVNRDVRMKFKRKRTFWIFWKRKPVFIRNSEGDLETVGLYNGEALKKQNYYMIGLYNKLGMFRYIETIILIPIELKKTLVEKMDVDGNVTIVLNCEGIDNIGNTDYYYMPLISDPKNPKEFLDFSYMIHKDYIENVVYTDVIKENLQSYRESVIKAVESNPEIHFGRRIDKSK